MSDSEGSWKILNPNFFGQMIAALQADANKCSENEIVTLDLLSRWAMAVPWPQSCVLSAQRQVRGGPGHL